MRAQRLLEARGGYAKGKHRRYAPEPRPEDPPTHPLQAWRYGMGANMAFWAEALYAVDRCDADLPTVEDLDMLFRVLLAGWDILYEPKAVVRHHHPHDMPSLRRSLRLFGMGHVAFLLKAAQQHPNLRPKALAEARHWLLSHQVRQRLLPALLHRPQSYAPSLVLAEICGGLEACLLFMLHALRTKASGPTASREDL